MTLKSQLRNTQVHTIVLTPRKEYSNFLLGLNDFAGVVPLLDTYPDFRQIYPDGDWASMHWPIDALKISARYNPELASVDGEIDI